ncbi:WbqC family protein [Streptosporangium canum]|uniref:WbqC family protein n=1 Tax=Streptosporangium canum TaxID=324952 RepID=UPI0037B03773
MPSPDTPRVPPLTPTAAACRTDVVVAHQPAFLPWLGYLARLIDVDRLVLLDHVQYTERGWQNRNYIRGAHGQAQYLTVPVRQPFGQPIDRVRIAEDAWRARHWRTLTQTYGRAPHWPAWQKRLQAIYQRSWSHLIDLNEALLQLLLDGFDLRVKLVRSSTLNLSGRKSAMLVDLCRVTGAQVLRTGTGAIGYLDAGLLHRAGISVEIATYSLPLPAPAPGGVGSAAPFAGGRAIEPRTGEPVPLSALDALLHHGPNARHLLEAGAGLQPWTAAVGS